ncbi:MAG: NAD(P)H-quinone oxidoreductase [Acidobacteriota bacterium]|nr:NAD(P)H-quinone oxidoreductase [Acidobacteriota bacterium]
MKAVWIREFGGAENLEVREIADLPMPTADRVLIRVKAAALNRADLLQRRGLYPAPKGLLTEIPGLELAGEIIAIGDAVQNLKIGQRVFGITAGAAQAEFVSAPENTLVEIPANLNFTEAAAVPEAFITAHDALFSQASLRMGETVLIHAIGSGVGLAAAQLAKVGGAFVVGTSRTAEKIERAGQLGLDVGVLTKNELSPERFAEIVRNETDGAGVNVVLDLVGAKYLAGNLLSLAKLGRLVFVGTTAGSRAEIDILTVMTKRLRLFGTVLRSRSAEEKATATRLFAEQVVPLLARGIVKPTVDRVFPLAEIRAAHEYLESNQSFGKVVLEI